MDLLRTTAASALVPSQYSRERLIEAEDRYSRGFERQMTAALRRQAEKLRRKYP
jgi:hypothetical protein